MARRPDPLTQVKDKQYQIYSMARDLREGTNYTEEGDKKKLLSTKSDNLGSATMASSQN